MAPKSLLLVEGQDWETQRHKLARLFAPNMVKLMRPIISDLSSSLFAKWAKKFYSIQNAESFIVVDIHKAMTKYVNTLYLQPVF